MAKFCPECGFKQHNDNNRYCSNCGFDFSKLEEIESNLNGSEVSGINLIDDSEDTSVNVPIIDLEDSEDSKPFTSEPSHSVSHAGDSKSMGSSSSSSVDSNSMGSNSSSSSSSIDSKPKITVSNSSSNSNRKRKTNANQKAKSKKSSDLSFNKCFVTIAAFLIILVIFGLLTEAFQPEPYSDRGITSFMEKSTNYNLNNYLEEISNEINYFNPDDVLGNGVAIINYFPPSK